MFLQVHSIISFDKTEHSFGFIKQGDTVKYTFIFYNIGNHPLRITNVSTTCGCTTTNWTREPIQSFAQGEISIEFDSHGKYGLQNKVIIVYSNSPNYQTFLKIKAYVVSR